MSLRRRLANGARCWVGDSRSKSTPSITASPKGRCFECLVLGPKVRQNLVAALVALEAEGKPPSS